MTTFIIICAIIWVTHLAIVLCLMVWAPNYWMRALMNNPMRLIAINNIISWASLIGAVGGIIIHYMVKYW
jgi:hypothetical protein